MLLNINKIKNLKQVLTLRTKKFFFQKSSNAELKSSGYSLLLIWFYFCLPSKLFNAPTSFVIEDKDGNLLNASIAADGQWRFPYDENVPEKFIKCITTFEDKRFYYHPGVDPVSFGKSHHQKY